MTTEEWREYWTSGEYSDMREVLTPEKLKAEITRMRAKAEHYRIANEFGFDAVEAALMRISAMMAIHDVSHEAWEDDFRGELPWT